MAGPSLPLAALRDRERHSTALFARRASQARAHKQVNDSTRAFLAGFAAQYLGGSGLPPDLLSSLAETKAAGTWNTYVPLARKWFDHAAAHGLTAVPTDPVQFACWLAMVGRADRSYGPTKLRCCAIDALCVLAGAPPPSADPRIAALRSLFARTKTYRRGRAVPVLRAEIPAVRMECGPSSPPAAPLPGAPGRAGPSPNTRQRRLGATAAHMALMFDGTLRYDDTREGQLGDVSFYEDVVEMGIFGSKTDRFRAGQVAQLPPPPPAPDAQASGARALLEVTRHGLRRLLDLDPAVLSTLARRLAESFPRDSPTPGAMATWPQEIRDLALPLYGKGLLVHCLPYYGTWLWERLGPESNLAATLSTQQFGDLAKRVLADAGHPTGGIGAHSMRRGGAAELAHGGLDLATLSLALRHASIRSTSPYILRSVLTSATAGAMSGAVRRSRAAQPAAGPGAGQPLLPARGHLPARGVCRGGGLVHQPLLLRPGGPPADTPVGAPGWPPSPDAGRPWPAVPRPGCTPGPPSVPAVPAFAYIRGPPPGGR